MFQEIEFFTSSLSKLKMLQSKFAESQECVSKVTAQSEGKELLVPLTSSVSLTNDKVVKYHSSDNNGAMAL